MAILPCGAAQHKHQRPVGVFVLCGAAETLTTWRLRIINEGENMARLCVRNDSRFWLNLQSEFDFRVVRNQKEATIKNQVRPLEVHA